MRRTRIQLDDVQYEDLKAMAKREGKSLSCLIREAVSAFIRKRNRRTGGRLSDIEGIGEDADATGREQNRFLYAAKEALAPNARELAPTATLGTPRAGRPRRLS